MRRRLDGVTREEGRSTQGMRHREQGKECSTSQLNWVEKEKASRLAQVEYMHPRSCARVSVPTLPISTSIYASDYCYIIATVRPR